MPHGWRDAEGPQGAHAADAEHDLLLKARFAIAAVKARRQVAILRRVFLQAGIEQVKADAAGRYPPHIGQHGAIAERHGHDAGVAVRLQRLLDRHVGPVQPLVGFLLPAFGGNVLMEISLRVHEADAHERHTQVACLLAVVAGEHAEAARVDRQ